MGRDRDVRDPILRDIANGDVPAEPLRRVHAREDRRRDPEQRPVLDRTRDHVDDAVRRCRRRRQVIGAPARHTDHQVQLAIAVEVSHRRRQAVASARNVRDAAHVRLVTGDRQRSQRRDRSQVHQNHR